MRRRTRGRAGDTRSCSRPFAPDERRAASPNFVACGSAIDPLQNELEVEGRLELADHDDGRIIAPQDASTALTGQNSQSTTVQTSTAV
jgi:hypothetical protein